MKFLILSVSFILKLVKMKILNNILKFNQKIFDKIYIRPIMLFYFAVNLFS